MESKKNETKKKTTKKKNKDETVVLKKDNKEISEVVDVSENDSLKQEIELLKQQIASLSNGGMTIVNNTSASTNKNIKVISMASHKVVLKIKNGFVNFNGYGQVKVIRFNDMLDVLSSNSSLFEDGTLVFSNRDDAVDLDIEYIYDNNLNQKSFNKIISLETQEDVDLIKGLPKEKRYNIAEIIATSIAKNKDCDLNKVKQLDDIGLKISAMADDLKKYYKDTEESVKK